VQQCRFRHQRAVPPPAGATWARGDHRQRPGAHGTHPCGPTRDGRPWCGRLAGRFTPRSVLLPAVQLFNAPRK